VLAIIYSYTNDARTHESQKVLGYRRRTQVVMYSVAYLSDINQI